MTQQERLGGARIGQGTITHKELRKLVNAALGAGWEHRVTGGNHVLLRCPCGQHSATVSGTGNGRSGVARTRTMLTSCGDWP